MGAHGEHLELWGNPGSYGRRRGRKDKGTVWQEGRGAEVEYCRISPNDTGGLGPSGEKEAFSFQSNPKEESKFRRRYISKLFPEEIRVEKWGEKEISLVDSGSLWCHFPLFFSSSSGGVGIYEWGKGEGNGEDGPFHNFVHGPFDITTNKEVFSDGVRKGSPRTKKDSRHFPLRKKKRTEAKKDRGKRQDGCNGQIGSRGNIKGGWDHVVKRPPQLHRTLLVLFSRST